MASKVLRDVVVFFNQDDTALKKIATRLGATVSDSITKKVTHIIVEDKQNITRKMQREAKSAQLVNKNWIKHCEKNKKRVSESDFTVKVLGSPKQDTLLADKENCENESQKRGSQHHGLMYSSPRSGPSSQNMTHEIIGSNTSNKTPRSPRRPKSKRHLTPNQSTDGGYDSERDLFLSSDEREGDQSSDRVRCENSFYTSPIKEIELPANDNLKLLMDDDGSDVANESTDDEGNAKSSTSPKPRFADGSGQQTTNNENLNDTTDDATQVMDDKKKKTGGSESLDTAEQHPQDDSLNRTEELNNSLFNREQSTQPVIKESTIALSVQMMLENDWMSSPASLPALENLKQQSQNSPYRISSTPVQITSHMDTETILNAAVYKKQNSDPTSLRVPEEPQTDAESIEIPNEEETDINKNSDDNNSTKKRKRGLSKSTPSRPLKRRRSNEKVDEPQAEDQSTSKPKLRRARTKELPNDIKEEDIKLAKPKPTNLKRSTRSKRLDPVVKESDITMDLNSDNSTTGQHSSALKRSQRRHSKNFNTIRFLCSKCDDSVHEAGSKFAAMMPTTVTFDLEAETLGGVTHVVICKNERTLKVLQAIARGLYLVSSQWLHDCVEQKKILAADDYEVTKWFLGCRSAREGHAVGKLLFAGICPWIEGETRVPVEELKNIIVCAGGQIAKYRSEATVIISNEKLRGKLHSKAPVVSEKWVLDSLVGWSLLPHDDYCIS